MRASWAVATLALAVGIALQTRATLVVATLAAGAWMLGGRRFAFVMAVGGVALAIAGLRMDALPPAR